METSDEILEGNNNNNNNLNKAKIHGHGLEKETLAALKESLASSPSAAAKEAEDLDSFSDVNWPEKTL